MGADRRDRSGLGMPVSAALSNAAMGLVVLTWGLGPPIAKLITAPPLLGVTIRFFISLPVLFGLAYATGRRPTRMRLVRAAPAGIFFGLNNAAFFLAIQHASVAIVSVALALQPAVVLVAAGRLLGERPTGWQVWWAVVGIFGAGVVVVGGNPHVKTDALGVIYALLSMFALSGYHVINRHVRSHDAVDPIEWMAGATTFGCLILLPLAAVTFSMSDFRKVGVADFGYLTFLALGVGVFGHTLMSWVHRYIPAGRSALDLLMMNVVAVGAAWLINGESLTLTQAIGGVVVLLSVAAIIWQPANTPVRFFTLPQTAEEE